MKFKFTILNTAAFAYLIGCIIYTLVNYQVLSAGEGWGIAYVIVLMAVGLSAFLVDLIIRKLIKHQQTQQVISAVVTALYAVIIFLGSSNHKT